MPEHETIAGPSKIPEDPIHVTFSKRTIEKQLKRKLKDFLSDANARSYTYPQISFSGMRKKDMWPELQEIVFTIRSMKKARDIVVEEHLDVEKKIGWITLHKKERCGDEHDLKDDELRGRLRAVAEDFLADREKSVLRLPDLNHRALNAIPSALNDLKLTYMIQLGRAELYKTAPSGASKDRPHNCHSDACLTTHLQTILRFIKSLNRMRHVIGPVDPMLARQIQALAGKHFLSATLSEESGEYITLSKDDAPATILTRNIEAGLIPLEETVDDRENILNATLHAFLASKSRSEIRCVNMSAAMFALVFAIMDEVPELRLLVYGGIARFNYVPVLSPTDTPQPPPQLRRETFLQELVAFLWNDAPTEWRIAPLDLEDRHFIYEKTRRLGLVAIGLAGLDKYREVVIRRPSHPTAIDYNGTLATEEVVDIPEEVIDTPEEATPSPSPATEIGTIKPEPVLHVFPQDDSMDMLPVVVDLLVPPTPVSQPAINVKEEPSDDVPVHIKEELDEEQRLWLESGASIVYRHT